MPDITDFFGKPSIDTDHSVATTITADRTAGVTVISGFDLSTFTEDTPIYFVTYTKTTDPVTSEITITDLVSWKGLVNAGANTITNLTVAPGYVDAGNTIGQFVECIPTSYWGNELIDGLLTSLNSDGTPKQASLNPVGSIVDFAGSTAPSGWLLAYGQTLDATLSTEYADLYTVIGNTYGGTDDSDFVVPDLRGRVIAGQDDMGGSSADRLTDTSGGVDGDVLGDAGGDETHTLTEAQLASHDHGYLTQSGNYPAASTQDVGVMRSSASNYSSTKNTNNAGSGNAHNNVQPTIILNKIIKY